MRSRYGWWASSAAALALTAAFAAAPAARAATATVTTCSMGAAGSLDTLVAAAADGDTINFGLDCSGASAITFANDITIQDKGLTIDGTGHAIVLNGGWPGTYNGTNNTPNGGSSLFMVYTNSATLHYTFHFTNLTFENGNGFATGGPSGAISNTRDIVYITDCTFSGNTGNLGGALFAQSGSTITVTGSTFTGNVSPSLPSLSTGIGGAICSAGTLAVTNSTFEGNAITGTAAGAGGAIDTLGGSTTITACTISGNSAGTGYGGGLWGSATVSGSIIYGNTASNGPDAYTPGSFTSNGTNLIGVSASGFGGTDIVGKNPLLGALGSHGGATQTMPLLPGSPAIDAIALGSCAASADQRGVSRPQPGGGSCDVGAFESQGFSLSLASGNNQSTTVGTAFGSSLVVTVTASQSGAPYFEPVAGGQVTFAPPGSGASATLATSPATIAAGGTASVDATANGTPGTYSVGASAAGAPSGVSFTLTNIASPVTISPSTLSNGTYGQSYSQTFTPGGGSGSPYTFSLSSGSGPLPNGITLSSGGALSGTPTEVGTFDFSIHVADSTTGTLDQAYQLVVDPISCVVDSTADPSDAGHLTLRDAVTAVDAGACTGNLITFDSTVFPTAGPLATITLASGELAITHDATMAGSGARVLAVDGNDASGIFTVSSGKTVAMSGLTLTRGSDASAGGAIHNSGILTLTGIAISGCSAPSGGAIYSDTGSLALLSSTISGNGATGAGGGIYTTTTLDVANGTFSGNTAPNGDAIYASLGTTTITNATIAANGNGASASALKNGGSATVTATNSLIGGNTPPNCSGTIGSGGHNIDSDGSCGLSGTADLSGGSVALDLGPLADNGGPTDTIALHGGSAAIDAADAAVCSAAPVSGVDQRGDARPAGPGCDIGALEAVQRTLTATVTGPGTVSASGASPISGAISGCASSCAAVYSGEGGGDAVTLTAVPAAGAVISFWGADCGSTSGGTASLAMSADHGCTASFAYLPPTATGASFSTPVALPLSRTLAVSDPAGGTLTVNVTSPPADGVLTGPDGSGQFTYTPANGFHGADSFTFTVTSSVSGLTSAPATVTIEVDPQVAVPMLDARALALLALLLAAAAAWRLQK